MKHIKKTGIPQQYSDWCKRVKGKENEDYGSLQNPEKGILHQALILEQGYLCGYTMRRIDNESSHIEHIKPEYLCREEERGSDLDYENMIACFPRQGMISKYRYGAQQKDKWWEDRGAQFVSPLNPNCEKLLIFNLKGEIASYNNNGNAKKTIEVLKLDHKSLTEDRRRAIEEFIYGSEGYDPISHSTAVLAIQEIIKPLSNGEFVEFCIAIRYALNEYIQILRRIAAKRKYSQQQGK